MRRREVKRLRVKAEKLDRAAMILMKMEEVMSTELHGLVGDGRCGWSLQDLCHNHYWSLRVFGREVNRARQEIGRKLEVERERLDSAPVKRVIKAD